MTTNTKSHASTATVRALVAAALLVLSAAPLGSGSEHGEPGSAQSFRYTAGGATDTGDCISTATSTLCTMAGGAVCGAGASSDAVSESVAVENVGGACTGLRVAGGEPFAVAVTDDLGGPTAFGVCVDADEDGVCRPDVGGAQDHWVTRHCSSAGALTVTPPASGTLFVFVMDEVDLSGVRLCLPTTGTVTVDTPTPPPQPPQCFDGKDNDGDGLADWPHDPGCSGPTDNTEREATIN